jgi:uncharacterized protein (DUF927 family)
MFEALRFELLALVFDDVGDVEGALTRSFVFSGTMREWKEKVPMSMLGLKVFVVAVVEVE